MSTLRTHKVDENTFKEYRCTVCNFKTLSEKKAKKHQIEEGHFVDAVLVHGHLNRKL
ncbi:MAG: hypothetical protein KAJ19_14690 [Gammaproteobacteria bacterium]|nr:hypothetical protein [Gammaproteobacteria bacterium]